MSNKFGEVIHKQFLEDKTVIANILQYVNDEKFMLTQTAVEASGLPSALLEESLARCKLSLSISKYPVLCVCVCVF